MTQNKQYIEHKTFGGVRAVYRLCGFYPGICTTTEEKARKNLSQGSRRVPAGTMLYQSWNINRSPCTGKYKKVTRDSVLQGCNAIYLSVQASTFQRTIYLHHQGQAVQSKQEMPVLVFHCNPHSSVTRNW